MMKFQDPSILDHSPHFQYFNIWNSKLTCVPSFPSLIPTTSSSGLLLTSFVSLGFMWGDVSRDLPIHSFSPQLCVTLYLTNLLSFYF